jgi:nucleoid-associated protein YgaU
MTSGQLAKAEIENQDTNEKVICMFNPKEYSFSKTNNWKESDAKGQNVSKLEFSGGAPATLSLQLLFDTNEMHHHLNIDMSKGRDVRKYTEGLWNMMKINENKINPDTKKGEPPKCRFMWGNLWSFTAVITSISQKFTLFASDGTPLRAVVDVSFKQLVDEGQYPRQNPTSGGNPGEHLRTIREGDTLPYIAYEEYGDPTVWRHLATTNGIADPRRLRPGDLLMITPLPLR